VKLATLPDAVPLAKTFPAATRGGVLSLENGMASERGLFPVLLRMGRRKPSRDEITGMVFYGFQTRSGEIFEVLAV
jgi:hypothetical protein